MLRQQKQADQILEGLQQHAEETAKQVEGMMEPARELRVMAEKSLKEDREVMEQMKEEEKEELVQEVKRFVSHLLGSSADLAHPSQNARLRIIIEQLTATLEAERAASVDEDAELVALLSSKLSARSQRRAQALEETRSAAEGALEGVVEIRQKQQEKREQSTAELERSNESLGGAMRQRLGEVEQRGETSKTVRSPLHARALRER